MTERLPLSFDRATGRLEGASAVERAAALALIMGSKVSGLMEHRGFSVGCRIVASVVEQREIVVRLNEDALFAFPLSDGYWSKMLDRGFIYEDEIERFLRGVADVDYHFVDGGANFGYWSVLVSSRPFGRRPVVAIEASSANAAKLTRNGELNGNRFNILRRGVSAVTGDTAWISGAKHEAFQIGATQAGAGESVQTISLDGLIEHGFGIPGQRLVIKLDVEGMEIAAIQGGRKMLENEVVIILEEHGSDRAHSVSRYFVNETPYKLFVLDPRSQRYEPLVDLSVLDRIKAKSWAGYNVFATNSSFWEERIRSISPSTRH